MLSSNEGDIMSLKNVELIENVSYDLFEEDYITRTYYRLVNAPDIALTELIANSWDSGALNVRLEIPNTLSKHIVIEDDGSGMTREEFYHRWMKLGYKRIKHQGSQVIFPEDFDVTPRKVYGRNGIGRHSLFCFSDVYQVESWKNGTAWSFEIGLSHGNEPFKVLSERSYPKDGHGTRLEVVVNKNLPPRDEISEILAARFLYDPQFKVFINESLLSLSSLSNIVETEQIMISEDTNLKVIVIDSSINAKSAFHHGIAFWVGGRRVGEPTWILGKHHVADGRRKLARRHTIIVQSDDLYDEVMPDWSGFRTTEKMNVIYDFLIEYVRKLTLKINKDDLEETRNTALTNNYDELKVISRSRLAQREISNFVTEITEQKPDISQDILDIAIKAVINIEKSRSASSLLNKLSQMSVSEIDTLEHLLNEWSIIDIVSVIDEIDERLTTIEAISRLCDDSTVDELHTLHPIITKARWIFGPEYESLAYTFNKSLNRAARELFNVKTENDTFVNGRKRPDLIVLPESTISTVCTEDYNVENSLTEIKRILIIELKKGGFKLTRKEAQQAQGYVEDLLQSGFISNGTEVHAYVVGDTLDNKLSSKYTVDDRGKVWITSFTQLIDSASRRLFNLKEVLEKHYDTVETDNIVKRILEMPHQEKMNI